MLLEGLKEELFQLEIEKQEGRISSEDYEAAKNALNQTLKRALQRKS
jgi:ribosomal protein L16/L10AE